MSRLLFVGPPFVGHLNPLISAATELEARGHDVGWVGDEKLLRKLGVRTTFVQEAAFNQVATLAVERSGKLRGHEAVALLWGAYLDMARAMYAQVADALKTFQPCLVLCDQQTFAGSLAAREADYRWLTLATTSGEASYRLESHPGFHQWMTNALTQLGRDLGLGDSTDPRFSPFGTILFSSPALTGPLPCHLRIASVGCSIKYRKEVPGFPWEKLDDRRKVLISLGTLSDATGRAFLDEAWLACHERRRFIQTILLDPSRNLARVSDDDILILQSAPQLALLKQMDAVVSHGGQNSISEAISHGVPLVVAPIRDDQPINAAQVVEAGVGVRVRFGRPSAIAIGAAIDSVLTDPSYRAAAAYIQPSMSNGTDRAADAVEHFLRFGILN